jgi:MoxR-like ATPase
MNLASNLIYIGDDKRRSVDRINQLPSRRLYGSYPETAVEEVIEANRRSRNRKRIRNGQRSGDAINRATAFSAGRPSRGEALILAVHAEAPEEWLPLTSPLL